MPDSAAIVNHGFATILAGASRRTLLTLCHYHQLPQQLLAPPGLGRWVAEQLESDLPMRLKRLLTPSAQTLVIELLEAPMPARQGRMPWQLPLPRPAWTDLTPLEQLLALGVLVARRSGSQIALEFPAVMRAAVHQLATLAAPALPVVPPLLAVRDAAVHILLQLEQRPAAHRGRRCWSASTMAALLARGVARPLLAVLHPLLHYCGLLEHDVAGCRPAVEASRWLVLPPAEQLAFLLAAWQQQPLLSVDRLPEQGGLVVDWPALLKVVWTTLAHAPTPLTLQPLLAHCESVVGPLLAFPRAMASPRRRQPLPDPTALLEAVLTGPAVALGLVVDADSWLALTPDGHAWQAAPLTLEAPAYPVPASERLGLPLGAPAALIRDFEQGGVFIEQGDRICWYGLDVSRLRRMARAGRLAGFQRRLEQAYGDLPTAILDLLAVARPMPSAALTTWLVLELTSAAQVEALLDSPARRWLGRRLGPTQILVHPEQAERLRWRLERMGWLTGVPDPGTQPDADTVLDGTPFTARDQRSEHACDPSAQALLGRSAEVAAGGSPDHVACLPVGRDDLALALRIAGASAPLLASVLRRARVQLEADLPPVERAALETRWSALILEQPVARGWPPRLIQGLIQAALESGEALAIRYASASSGTTTWRTIRPLHLRDGLLEAYCLRRDAVRTFACARILDCAPAAEGTPALPASVQVNQW